MRRSPAIVAAILVAACLIVFTSIGGVADESKPSMRWEYKVVDASADFNALGREGWELVATSTTASSNVRAYFKRPTK